MFVYAPLNIWNLYINMQAATVNIILGTHVWVEDPTVCWLDGQVTKINGKEVEIETTDGKKVRRFYALSN